MKSFLTIPDDFYKATEKQLGEAIHRVHKELIETSPVDTGRFQESWISSPVDTNAEAPEGRYPPKNPVAAADIKLSDPEQYLINNLHYAPKLCLEGFSRKAAADWFTSIGQRWESGVYLRNAAGDIE